MRTVRMPHPVDLVPGVKEAWNALRTTIDEAVPDLSDGEAAARALTEAAAHPEDVTDRIWDQAAKHFDQQELAAILLSAVLADAIDRLSTVTRQSKGMS